jgi:hypothetical protein
VLTGGGSGRDSGAAEGTGFEKDVGFDGGITARVDDLAGVDASNFGDIEVVTPERFRTKDCNRAREGVWGRVLACGHR